MTKNLKFAIAILATIASMNVNAQKKTTVKTTKPKTEVKTAKPTKQETMDWIVGKLKENLTERYKFDSYNNGIFIITTELRDGSKCSTSINLNKVTGMNNEYSADFYISGKALLSTKCPSKEEWNSVVDNVSLSGPNYNEYKVFFNITPDQELVDRSKKAFTTLIEYNSTKKGADEKF